MNNKFEILPLCEIQKSVSLSLDAVINKAKYINSEYPYAKAFCYFYFKTTTPSKALLFNVAPSVYTIPQIMVMLNKLIASNGNRPMFLYFDFVVACFPSLKNKVDFKIGNKINMNDERDFKLKVKETNKYKMLINKNRDHVLTLSNNQLSKWIYELDNSILDVDLITLLCDWFVTHDYGSAIDFHYAFEDESPSNIALELSFY
ncbi:hypothetical protein GNP80_08940 [Aliivibrio fischeri]|uniref:hypothetical protein n=1 Tax=Aliivibrio fischeri TaxID=668 RepID=UPI0012D8AA8D|nr:hypothetical protein [Aliivibrio fischeri]MUK92567.1 hypothetical protein [Aliivibrio fischeri]